MYILRYQRIKYVTQYWIMMVLNKTTTLTGTQPVTPGDVRPRTQKPFRGSKKLVKE